MNAFSRLGLLLLLQVTESQLYNRVTQSGFGLCCDKGDGDGDARGE